jgi:hypothetical protein
VPVEAIAGQAIDLGSCIRRCRSRPRRQARREVVVTGFGGWSRRFATLIEIEAGSRKYPPRRAIRTFAVFSKGFKRASLHRWVGTRVLTVVWIDNIASCSMLQLVVLSYLVVVEWINDSAWCGRHGYRAEVWGCQHPCISSRLSSSSHSGIRCGSGYLNCSAIASVRLERCSRARRRSLQPVPAVGCAAPVGSGDDASACVDGVLLAGQSHDRGAARGGAAHSRHDADRPDRTPQRPACRDTRRRGPHVLDSDRAKGGTSARRVRFCDFGCARSLSM